MLLSNALLPDPAREVVQLVPSLSSLHQSAENSTFNSFDEAAFASTTDLLLNDKTQR